MDQLDRQLIDKHFEFAELSRSYSPSGIYLKVQSYIDTELSADRKRHDAECEMRDGSRRRWCGCQDRRGYDQEVLADGSVAMRPRLT